MNMDDTEFISSELGTKEHWDDVYKEELENFNCSGDIGDIWYGEESVFRVINWIKSYNIPKESSFLDIGCGNGITFSWLADEGFTNLYGVDYCKEAVSLAAAVADKRGTPIQYEVGNIIESNNHQGLLNRTYDICHDKGTLDAISLDPDEGKAKVQIYIENVNKLVNQRGLFIISSCNWTEPELLPRFSQYFEMEAMIPTPVFTFGGKIGSSLTSLVLRKRN